MIERLARPLAPVVVAVYAVAGAAFAESLAGIGGVFAVAAVAVATVLARFDVSDVALMGGLVVILVLTLLTGEASPSNIGYFNVCVVTAWGALAIPPPRGWWVGAVSLVGVGASALVGERDVGWAAWIAGTLFTVVACSLARRQRELVEELRVAQAGLADRARSEERNRIAGELHDVIGHALTVSLLHVSSARLSLADGDTEEAEASLAEAERLSRQSLAEVRAAVGLMRGGDGRVPLPGTADLDELVESFRRAGTAVAYRSAGDLATVNSGAGLTLYRILQEALTNVARHAPGASAQVEIDVVDGRARLRVDNRCGEASGPDGNGVIGMRERAEAVGGSLTAGPAVRSGARSWEVEAVVPT